MNAPANHLPDDRSFADAQQFLLLAKRYWTTTLTPALREDDQQPVPDPALTAAFAWLERHLQRAKYSGRYGLQQWFNRDREQHEAQLETIARAASDRGLLTLNPDLPLPDAFTRVDIHQHPGGVWSDPLAGLVYERGARTTTPLAGQRHKDLHDRLAEQLSSACPKAKQILDMGCGFGKSTMPIAEQMPDAKIVALDIAAPCLTVGAAQAMQSDHQQIQFRQADARDCGAPDDSMDAVTSTMLLHEMPADHLPELFAEAYRLLRPGGVMLHLDFLPDVQPGANAFTRQLHSGHLVRNNEPYMRDLMQTDLNALMAACGFTEIRIGPFEEADGALDPDYSSWRFPWALVSARKPSDTDASNAP